MDKYREPPWRRLVPPLLLAAALGAMFFTDVWSYPLVRIGFFGSVLLWMCTGRLR